MIKVTLIEVMTINNILGKIVNTPMNLKLAYQLSKILKKIIPEINQIEQEKIKLVDKYKGEDGQIPEDKVEQLNDKFSEFLQTEIKIDSNPVVLKESDPNLKLTPMEMLKLEKVLFFE
jgi:hypothetical protein